MAESGGAGSIPMRVWPGHPYPLGATWDGMGYPRRADNDADFDERDSAPFARLACVIEPEFSWGDDRAPRTPWHETAIYEVHVKGFTRRHPLVPENVRSTYAGLASSAAIRHLRDLGVTAVELMPIHYHINDRFLVESGRTNYWGYRDGTDQNNSWNCGIEGPTDDVSINSLRGMGLLGSQIDEADAQGERSVGDSFLILLNAHDESVSFRLSARARDQNWELVFDTLSAKMTPQILGRLAEYPLQSRSVAVLRRQNLEPQTPNPKPNIDLNRALSS